MGSWVTLNAGTSEFWARGAHLHGGPNVRGAYKGQIIDGEFKVGNVGREFSTTLKLNPY